MGIYSTYIPGAGAKFFEFLGKFYLECRQKICPRRVPVLTQTKKNILERDNFRQGGISYPIIIYLIICSVKPYNLEC